MFGRIAKVEIQSKGDKLPTVYSGLDVKFRFSDVPGTFKKNVSISILNLDINTIKSIMSIIGAKSDVDWADRPKVKLYVGYADRDKSPILIFSGVGMTANMTQPPNVWLNMTCQTADNIDQKQYTVEVPGAHTIREIIQTVAGNIGFGDSVTIFDDDATSKALDRTISNYSISDTRGRIISKLSREIGACIIRTEGDHLFIGDMTSLSKVRVKNTKRGTKDDPFVLTGHDGIVGLPYWKWPRLHVKTMLNPNLFPFAFVNISCPQVPLVDNGNPYQIMSLSHSGQLRQGEWVSQIELMSVNYSDGKDKKAMVGQ